MYRLATLLALLMVLVAAGCGGSDDDSDSASSAVADTSESSPSGDDGSASASADDAKAKTKKKDDAAENSSDDDESKTDEEVPDDPEEAVASLPLDEKSKLIETVVRSALLRFSLEMVDVQILRGGRAVTATVARRGACNFVASQEPSLVQMIQKSAPSVKSARFEVAGTGQQLSYYVLSCETPEIPNGEGRVVLDHTGVGGPYTSQRFRITSKRWALEWVNEAATLAAIVVPVGGESEGEYFEPVGSQKRESGREEYTGRGTFKIKAHGAGAWQLRVKEIG